MNDIEMREQFCRPVDERILISFCMKDLSLYFAVCARLSPDDFLYNQHENIMTLLQALSIKGSEKLDLDIVSSEAIAQNIINDIGGLKYLQTIYNIKASSKNFELHLNAVVEACMKYKLCKILDSGLHNLEENAKDGLSGFDLVGSLEGSIMGLSTESYNINEPKNLADGLAAYIENKRANRITISGLSTGFPILDKQIDGLIPGTLTVVAARKKMGKSTFLSNIATYIAYVLRKPILYVDTELNFEEWRTRALATISGVKERDIKHGGYDDTVYMLLQKALRVIDGGKLFHEYMPGYSVDKLVALYKKYKYKESIGLIAFDYLKEPDSSSVDRQRKEYQILGDITTKLKDLSGQLNIPALTAVQLNRDNDVADSDRVARFADVLCVWSARTKEEQEAGGYDCGSHKLVIRDTRRGGATSEEGIGYIFFKEKLGIREVKADKQYFHNFKEVQNIETAADCLEYKGYIDEQP